MPSRTDITAQVGGMDANIQAHALHKPAMVRFYQGIAATGQGFFDDEPEHALKLFRANEPDAVIFSNDP